MPKKGDTVIPLSREEINARKRRKYAEAKQTLIPTDFQTWQSSRYIAVHGLVTVGQFMDLNTYLGHENCDCRK